MVEIEKYWSSCTVVVTLPAWLIVTARNRTDLIPAHFVHFSEKCAAHVSRIILSMLLVSDICSDQLIINHHVTNLSQVCSEGSILQSYSCDQLFGHKEGLHHYRTTPAENIAKHS